MEGQHRRRQLRADRPWPGRVGGGARLQGSWQRPRVALHWRGMDGVQGRAFKRQTADTATDRPPLFAAVRAGFVWLARHGQLRLLAVTAAAGNLAYNAAWATFVLLATDKHGLNVAAAGFGLLISAYAVGGVLGGLLTSRLSAVLRPEPAVIVLACAHAVAWPLIAPIAQRLGGCAAAGGRRGGADDDYGYQRRLAPGARTGRSPQPGDGSLPYACQFGFSRGGDCRRPDRQRLRPQCPIVYGGRGVAGGGAAGRSRLVEAQVHAGLIFPIPRISRNDLGFSPCPDGIDWHTVGSNAYVDLCQMTVEER
jgi:hypothetical protein